MNFQTAKKYLDKKNLIRIGKILKTHGYKGQLKVQDFINFEPLNNHFFVELQGFILPVEIQKEFSNFKTQPFILKFKFVDTIDQARDFVGTELFYPTEKLELPKLQFKYEFLLGFKFREKGKIIGVIKDYIPIVFNPLYVFYYEASGISVSIPINTIYFYDIDLKNRIVDGEIESIDEDRLSF